MTLQSFGNISTGYNPIENASSFNNITFQDHGSDKSIFKDMMTVLNQYVTPLLVVVGVVGNTLSCLVFICTRLRHQSSSIYLACLAIVDTVFLFSVFIAWLSWLKIHLVHQEGWCHVVIYMTYVCGFMSVWCVVCFTVERYIVVSFPLKKHTITSKRAKIIVCSLCAFSLAVYSFAIWTSEIKYDKGATMCKTRDEHVRLVFVLSNIDSLVTLLLPMIVIVFLNIKIVIKVYQFQKRHSSMSSVSYHLDCNSLPEIGTTTTNRTVRRQVFGSLSHQQSYYTRKESRHVNKRRVNIRMRTQMRITRLLLLVSTVFIILNLPSHAIRAHAFIKFSMTQKTISPNIELRFQELLQFMYYSSFSVNFFLYSFCGRNFRKGLLYLFKGLKTKMCCGCSINPRQSDADYRGSPGVKSVHFV